MNKQPNVKEWVAMFRDIGLEDRQMDQWHKLFETRHPEGHQSFLESLGLGREDIDRIRAKSR